MMAYKWLKDKFVKTTYACRLWAKVVSIFDSVLSSVYSTCKLHVVAAFVSSISKTNDINKKPFEAALKNIKIINAD